ncbi:MAG: carboxypeptidase-like regulatory domain-containing protein, partial [Balneola sp.]
MKKFYYLFVLGLFFSVSAFAQTGTISGTVIDDATGDAFTGVSVVLVELQKGDPSDLDGNYELTNIPYGTYTLRATFVGYENFETQVTVNSASKTVNISLKPTVGAFDEVIVTAFGLSREEKSIGYAVQDVSGDDLTLANESNIVGALAGKVSGVQVIGTSGANIGGSSKIRLRGTNGLSDGQPLFVVDGTPINNRSFSGSAVGRDYGNLAGDINLDDVESVSVLKGAAASALYGNRASNGVILITTKGGSLGENQPLEVNFKSSTTFDNIYILPEYQDEYAGGYTQNFIPVVDPVDGQTYNTLNYAADESWGPKMDGTTYRPWYSWYQADVDGDGTSEYGKTIPLQSNPDNVRNFFDTGLSFDNYLSISGGSRNATYRVSIDNKQQTGVMPNSELDVTSLGFNGGLRHNDKFISNVRLNYINTKGSGRPPQGYSPTQGNAVQSFNQWFQRQLDMDMLRNYRATDGTLTSWNIRSATDTRPLYWDSPFFSIYENVPEDSRDRFYGNYTIGYNILSNLTVEAKVHADIYDFVIEDRIATGGLEQDSYSIAKRSNKEINYEIGVNHQTEFEDFTFNSFAGANLR